MFLDKFKQKKYMDLILTSAIALFLVIICSFIFIRFIDGYKSWFGALGRLYSIISPFIYSIILAYIINPIVKLFERRFKLKKSISILITYVILAFVIVFTIIYIVPKIANSAFDFIKHIPDFAVEAEEWVSGFISTPKIQKVITSLGISLDLQSWIGNVSEIAQRVTNSLISTMIIFTKSLIKWVFGFLLSIYILSDKENLIYMAKRFLIKIFKVKKGRFILGVGSNLNKMIGSYVGIKAVDSLIIGIISFIGLTLIGSEYSILIAIVVAITNMIPYFGPFVGMLVSFFINIFFSPTKAIFSVILLFLIQQFDAWYLDPKLIGHKVGLTPLSVVFAVTIGGGLYGMLGMVLAVPIMAVIRMYIQKYLNKNGLKSKGKDVILGVDNISSAYVKDEVKDGDKDKNKDEK